MDIAKEYQSLFVGLCDINGQLRGKRVPATSATKVINSGIRMPLSTCSVDIWGNDIEGSPLVLDSGDQDAECVPTERGIVPIDWLDKPTGFMPISMLEADGTPFLGDPRNALKAVLANYEKIGLKPVVASELEFYLVDKSQARPRPPNMPASNINFTHNDVLSLDVIESNSAFIDELYASCDHQNIPADAVTSEGGAGQFEINLEHQDDALKAADDAYYFKRTVGGLAQKHGMAATFMAKPYVDKAGNGFHIHFSVLDQNGVNVFDDGTEKGSDTLRHAIGGLLAAMTESTLIFAPHYNSYRRFERNSHAPIGIAWGYENRTAAIRVPGGSHKARRIEHRVAGGDINPYLVIAVILGAALYGIENKLEPSAPIEGNAYEADSETIPTTWRKAIDTFKSGKILPYIFDEDFIDIIARCKQQELERFFEQITDREYATYLETV